MPNFNNCTSRAKGERAAIKEGKARLVPKVEKLVLEFRRPVGQKRKGIFSAGTNQPAAIGVGCTNRGSARQICNRSVIANPTPANLEIDKGAIQGQANTTRKCS